MKAKISLLYVALFFMLTVIWSDSIWILLTPSVQKKLHLTLNLHWAWVGLMGPGLMAVFVSWLSGGWSGIIKLFIPLLRWKTNIIYYVFVYAGVFLFYCAASWVTVLFQGYHEAHNIYWLIKNVKAPFFNLSGIFFLIEITIIYTLCEELGWRGFALPHLLNNKINALTTALIIGFIWTIWHVPLIYLYGSSFSLITFLIYLLHIVCFSIFYTWLYLKTNWSLLLVGLFHGATDAFGSFFPLTASSVGQGPNLYTALLELFVALLMVLYLFKYKGRFVGVRRDSLTL